jgi:hypothetical protein
MGRGKAHIDEWAARSPVSAPLADVDAVLEEFFAGCYERGGKETRVIRHRWLRALTEWRELGVMSIATVKGRKVKRCYLDDLVFVVGWFEWLRAHDWPEDRDVPRELAERYEQEYR